MAEKLVGKVNYFHDPDLITYGSTGANFYDTSKHSQQGRIVGTFNDFMLFAVEIIISGWWAFFVLLNMFIYEHYFLITTNLQSQMVYTEYLEYMAHIMNWPQIYIVIIMGIIIILFFILNKIFNREFQTALRGNWCVFVFPFTTIWRKIHRKNGDMSARIEGQQNKRVFTFFLKQYICMDLLLEGDFKKQFENLEWTNGDYYGHLPANWKLTKFAKSAYIAFLMMFALLGDYGNTRKITIYFKNPPQDGYLKIDTF